MDRRILHGTGWWARRFGGMGNASIRRALTTTGTLASRPAAFLVVPLYGLAWYFLQPATFDWNAVATLSVWLMTLFIQRAGHRDTQAVHAKLDELLHAQAAARNEITRMDEEEPEDIERRRTQPAIEPPRATELVRLLSE